jgi:hypothetical protein
MTILESRRPTASLSNSFKDLGEQKSISAASGEEKNIRRRTLTGKKIPLETSNCWRREREAESTIGNFSSANDGPKPHRLAVIWFKKEKKKKKKVREWSPSHASQGCKM